MAAGNAMTIGDFVFEFDSCLQDFSEDMIMAVYRKALQGYDVVSAVPQKKNRFSSRLFYFLLERYSRVPIDLNTERFCVVSRRVINRVKDLNQKIPYRKMAYATSGLRTSSVAYPVLDTGSDGVLEKKERKYRERLAVDTLLLFTDVGYRMASGLSVLMMLIAVFMAVYSLVIYLSAVPVAGWTTTILFLSIAFVGLFALLAILLRFPRKYS
jgi:dolichol-phosphate mannosyltransferase